MALFETVVIVLALVMLLILYKLDHKVLRRFSLIFIGVLLFQYFTQALWLTVGLESWSYLYLGINWIITLGRTTMVLVSVALVDLYLPKFSERTRFWIYLIPIVLLGIISETISAGAETIQYHPALEELFSGLTIIGKLPIESLFYIPIFMIFVLSFMKYWEKSLDKSKVKKTKRGSKK
jgi:hypothetical protein